MKTNNNESIILPDGGEPSLASRSSPSPTSARKNACGLKLAGVAALVTLLFVDRVGAQNIFVSNFLGNNITEFDQNGNLMDANYATGLANPEGLGFDANGNLYVDESLPAPAQGYVAEFSPSGTLINVSFATGLDEPIGMAFNASGDLYVVNSEIPKDGAPFTVSEFNASGDLIDTLSGGLDEPTYIAIEAAPEPSTRALLALGAAGLVGLRRRQGAGVADKLLSS
jgi:hypothetical protein